MKRYATITNKMHGILIDRMKLRTVEDIVVRMVKEFYFSVKEKKGMIKNFNFSIATTHFL